jgi:hypothetical protein
MGGATMIKTIALCAILVMLTGCKIPCPERWEFQQPERWERVFNNCLDKTAAARKGQNYTTNDSEDYDKVVKACLKAANIAGEERLIKHCEGE